MPRRQDEDVENASTVDGTQQAYGTISIFLTKIRKSPENEGSVDIILSQTNARKNSASRKKSDDDTVEIFQFDMHTEIDDLANEITDRAVEDCESLRAKEMRYSVRAGGIEARCGFTLKGDDGEEDDIDDIDDLPNRKGLLGLLMRHTQGQHKLSIGTSKHLIDALMAQLEKKEEIILKLQERSMLNIQAYEELISGKHMRDVEVQKMENKDRRMDQLAGTVLQGFPLLVTKFLGGGAGAAAMQAVPGARTPMETLIEGFIHTLDSQQLNNIIQSGIFSPVQIAGLVEIVKFVMEREEADKKAAEAKGHPSPPGHANGTPPAGNAAPPKAQEAQP